VREFWRPESDDRGIRSKDASDGILAEVSSKVIS
jgi:hypothetical protein